MYESLYRQIFYYVKDCVINKRDFTLRIDEIGNLSKPKVGFIVSITPLINMNMSTEEIINYIISTKTLELDKKVYGLYLGGWFEKHNENLKIDISITIDDINEAIQIGIYCNQTAIYDIERKKVIYLKK